MSADHSQIWKESFQRAQSVDPIEQQVAADLPEVWERDGIEVARLGVLDEDDGKIALDDGAVAQNSQVVDLVRYPH